MVMKIIESKKPIYVLEDSIKIGGLGSAILEYASANELTTNLRILGLPDEFIEHGSIDQIQKQYNLDTESIIKTVLK